MVKYVVKNNTSRLSFHPVTSKQIIWCSCRMSITHDVYVGDHFQLPPILGSYGPYWGAFLDLVQWSVTSSGFQHKTNELFLYPSPSISPLFILYPSNSSFLTMKKGQSLTPGVFVFMRKPLGDWHPSCSPKTIATPQHRHFPASN